MPSFMHGSPVAFRIRKAHARSLSLGSTCTVSGSHDPVSFGDKHRASQRRMKRHFCDCLHMVSFRRYLPRLLEQTDTALGVELVSRTGIAS